MNNYKKYIAFLVPQWPYGGLDDIIGSFDTLEEATDAVEKEGSHCERYVLDRDTWKKVYYRSKHYDTINEVGQIVKQWVHGKGYVDLMRDFLYGDPTEATLKGVGERVPELVVTPEKFKGILLNAQYSRQQAKTPHPSDSEGANMQAGGNDNEGQAGVGEGKDRKSVEG